MVKRIQSSREHFSEYKQDLARRRRERNGAPPPSFHSTAPERIGGRVRSSGELLRRFYGLLKGLRGPIGFALVTLTISTCLGLIPPAATKFIVDYVLTNQPLPESLVAWGFPTDSWSLLLTVSVGVFLLAAVRIVLGLSGRWLATRSNKRLQMSLRKRLFEHTVRLPLHRVYELKSGGVASILREDAGSVGDLVFGMLYNPWRAIIQVLGSLIVLAWVDWRLLLGTLILVPLIFLTHRTWIHRIRPQFRDIRQRRTEVDGQATEIFGGMRVVRAFSGQRGEAGRFMHTNHLMGRQELYTWWWSRTIEVIWDILIPLGSGALMLYGGWQVLQGHLTLGDLMMFLVYLLMLLEPLAVLAQSATQFQNGLSALDRILDIMDEPREFATTAAQEAVDRDSVAGRISFEDVTFFYPQTETPALSDVTLEVPAGAIVALVGPSGAGKTTLCNLVARFFDPTEGRVLLDGRDLREFDVESYRRLLGVVEQDVFLFDGTIGENIGYADRQTTMEAVREAARVANALEFIDRLPDGFDTVIGERGVKLSGGQRQRIAIARAVLADPRILILDEATSNLDTESERLIQQSLQTLMKNRTCFVIAHRLSTIAHADRIAVIEHGRITEQGDHDTLMQADGRYREMVLLQTSPAYAEKPDT